MNTLNELYDEKELTYFESVRKEIAPLLPEKVDRVLEIGCGSGATLLWIRETKGPNWIGGVELSGEAASLARNRLNFFIEGNIENADLPIEENSLDLILCLDVLEHLVDPWKVVDRLTKLIRPGGALIASLPNISNRDVLVPLIKNDRWDYETSGLLDRTHLRFFTGKTSTELLETGGLKVDKRVFVSAGEVRGSKTWLFNLVTFKKFEKFFITQYLIRAVKPNSR